MSKPTNLTEMTDDQIITYLKEPYVLRETNSPGDVIDQMKEAMGEAAKRMEALNEDNA